MNHPIAILAGAFALLGFCVADIWCFTHVPYEFRKSYGELWRWLFPGSGILMYFDWRNSK